MAISTRAKREAALLGSYIAPDGTLANATDRTVMLDLYPVGLVLEGSPPTSIWPYGSASVPRTSGTATVPRTHGTRY